MHTFALIFVFAQMFESVNRLSQHMRSCADMCDNFIKTVARHNPNTAAIILSQSAGPNSNAITNPFDARDFLALTNGTLASGGGGGGGGASAAQNGTASPGKVKSKRERKKEKKVRDPNAPKRPPSAYLLFQNEVRQDMRKRHPGMPYSEVLGKVSEAWKALTEDQRKVSSCRVPSEGLENGRGCSCGRAKVWQCVCMHSSDASLHVLFFCRCTKTRRPRTWPPGTSRRRVTRRDTALFPTEQAVPMTSEPPSSGLVASFHIPHPCATLTTIPHGASSLGCVPSTTVTPRTMILPRMMTRKSRSPTLPRPDSRPSTRTARSRPRFALARDHPSRWRLRSAPRRVTGSARTTIAAPAPRRRTKRLVRDTIP